MVALYATFLNRAFDQVLMDVALHRCGVTFVLDRAGVTGDDGASHNGMWDMSILQVVPGLRLAAPRDAARLRELLGEAVEVDDAPTVVRFPKGPPPADIEAVGRRGGCDVLVRNGTHDVLIVSSARWRPPPSRSPTGWSPRASASPWSTRAGSSRSTPRWSTWPASTGSWSASRTTAMSAAAARCCSRRSTTRASTTPVRLHGIPQEFLDHAKRAVILERVGLAPQALARGIVEAMAAVPADEPSDRQLT